MSSERDELIRGATSWRYKNVGSMIRPTRLLLLSCVLVVCCQAASSQNTEPTSGKPLRRDLAVEQCEFEARRAPFEHVNPGLLKFGEYVRRDPILTQGDYSAKDRKYGGVVVEKMDHPSQYPFGVRDLFGTFRSIASHEMSTLKANVVPVDGVVNEGRGTWSFLKWELPGGADGGTICVLLQEKDDIGPYEGLVGWYARTGDNVSTIILRFTNLRGVPARLIDELLVKYPSALTEGDFRGETWVEDDVDKWLHLLELYKADRGLFRIALGHLASRDPDLFGARDIFKTAADQVRAGDLRAIDKTIEVLRARTKKWLAERAEIEDRKVP